MFEALFNMTPGALADARFGFAWPAWSVLLACVLAVPCAWLLGGYLRQGMRIPLPMGLRGALAVLLVVLLARPEAVVPVEEASDAPVLVLLDDSLSMRIADGPGGATRAAQALDAFAAEQGSLARELEARHEVRQRRFASAPDAIDGSPDRFAGAVSDPLGALARAAAGERLSGIVLVSDGGQHRGGEAGNDGAQPGVSGPDRVLARLKAAAIPVHVVHVGAAGAAPDLSVQSLSMPDTVLPGDRVDVTAWLHARGFDGETVRVTARDSGVLMAQTEVTITNGRGVAQFALLAEEAGLRTLTVEAEPPLRDVLVENNRRARPLRVRPQPARVLHFEGEPRFEVKFLRRAVAADAAIALASLVRTGDNRFLRLGALEPAELADGFPVTGRDLFRYDVIVIGSVEAAALGAAGPALLEEHVARRGGSVLFLGGRNALAEGGLGATSLARLLPVKLGEAQPQYRSAAAVVLTRDGARHPVTRDLLRVAGAVRATALPALAVVNPVRVLKPGASVLLAGEDGGPRPIAMLSWHRYGAGRVAVLPARDTWRWRMHADVAPDDRTHELFWQRLLRWLARDVPAPLEVHVFPAVAAPGEVVELQAWPRDADWRVRSEVTPRLQVTTPLGEILEREMVWTAGEHGAFTARVQVRDAGLHEIEVTAARDDGGISAGSAAVLVDASGEEFDHRSTDDSLLRRIAVATGGSYRRLDEAAGLAERVAASAPTVSDSRVVALWNAPALLLAILALATAEWWLRRRRGALP